MTSTTKAVAIIEREGQKLTISFDDVRKYLCSKASDAEIGLFLKVCQSEGLNPFKRECFLVKYTDDQLASIIIATETFLKSAEACPEYDGTEAGIILKDTVGKLEFREGSFLLDEEEKNLVGGWAKAYRKDRQRPVYAAVNIKECQKYTREGKPTRFWREMPATMVRKVALSRVLREAFPNRFGGTLTTAEFEEIPEGQLPPAMEKNGKPDWKKFWARVKSELGLTTEEARILLQVDSIKEELINARWTMEQIWDELVSTLQHQKATEVKPDQAVDVHTGEIVAPEEDLFAEGEKKAGVATPAEAEKQPSAAPAKPKRDPNTIKTLGELYTACHQDWPGRFNDRRSVWAELGFTSQEEIKDIPADCYRKIAAVRS